MFRMTPPWFPDREIYDQHFQDCHPGEGRDPPGKAHERVEKWIPAFAGMTILNRRL